MILERYLIREIIRPAVATCSLLVFIFGCYMATRYWADAAQGELPGITVMVLILLRILIALEVLIPTTLFLSVVSSLNRLHRNSEITALSACGIGPDRIFRAVAIVALCAAVIVGSLSLYVRPWAWNEFFTLKSQARARFDLSRMKGGIFYEIWHGKRVMFAQKVDSRKKRAEHVFIYTDRQTYREVISAKRAIQYEDVNGKPFLILTDGCQYQYSEDGSRSFMMEFKRSEMFLEPATIEKKDRVKAVALTSLLGSRSLEESAELQWRFIAPVSTILLALLGVPLGKSSPRQGRSMAVPLAIVVFALYYVVAALLKKWVSQGLVPEFPGLWLSQLFLVILLFVFVRFPRLFSSQ